MDATDKFQKLHQNVLGPDAIVKASSSGPDDLAEMRRMVNDRPYGPYLEALMDGQENTLEELTAQNETLREQVEIAKKASRSSTRLSVLALIVAGASFIVALLTLLLR